MDVKTETIKAVMLDHGYSPLETHLAIKHNSIPNQVLIWSRFREIEAQKEKNRVSYGMTHG